MTSAPHEDPYQEQTQHALLQALQNQDELNQRLSPDWIHMGWDLHRAAMAEAAECLGYLNWAWWKSDKYGTAPAPAQRQQLWMEIVDVFHFLMSIHLRELYLIADDPATRNPSKMDARAVARGVLAQNYLEQFATTEVPTLAGNRAGHIAQAAEGLIHALYRQREGYTHDQKICVTRFVALCQAAGLSLERLLVYYAGKRALNMFRWNNAYSATGTAHYAKRWLLPTATGGVATVEDNQVLLKLLDGYMDTAPRSDILEACSSGELHTLIYDGLLAQWDVHQSLTHQASPPPRDP